MALSNKKEATKKKKMIMLYNVHQINNR